MLQDGVISALRRVARDLRTVDQLPAGLSERRLDAAYTAIAQMVDDTRSLAHALANAEPTDTASRRGR